MSRTVPARKRHLNASYDGFYMIDRLVGWLIDRYMCQPKREWKEVERHEDETVDGEGVKNIRLT